MIVSAVGHWSDIDRKKKLDRLSNLPSSLLSYTNDKHILFIYSSLFSIKYSANCIIELIIKFIINCKTNNKQKSDTIIDIMTYSNNL